jgi:hypothetical protein
MQGVDRLGNKRQKAVWSSYGLIGYKDKNPKYRPYWYLIEFIDRRYRCKAGEYGAIGGEGASDR